MSTFRTCILRLAVFVLRSLLCLRYRVRYVGLKKALDLVSQYQHERVSQEGEAAGATDKDRGVLFFPNHPAVVVDPLIVALPFIVPLKMRPLITEYMYFHPVFHPVMKWIGALPVPNFSAGVNSIKIDRLQRTLDEVRKGLRSGETFLLYPSGTTKQGPREIIGGAFAAHDLLQEYPNTAVVLVRTTGLWGSRFSRAYTQGKQVDMMTALKVGLKCFLKNLFFFSPRRDVSVEFEVVLPPTSQVKTEKPQLKLPLDKGRLEFNKWLEKWYNEPFEKKYGPRSGEPLLLVRESCWSEEISVPPPFEEEKEETFTVPDEIRKSVIEKIAELAKCSPESIKPEQHLVADLGLDSLNIAELITYIEVHFDQRGINPQEMTSVRKAMLFAAGLLNLQQELVDPPLDTTLWEKPREEKRLFIPEAETIIDAFFTTASQYSSQAIAGDARSGIISYSKVKAAVFFLAREIAKFEGENIGILLPSSLTANILVLASQLAGKVPVMINWTVGGNHLESVVKYAQLKVVLTSWAFLDRLENVDLSALKGHLVVLEEAKATFSWSNYIVAKIASLFPWDWIKKYTKIFPGYASVTSQSRAVILFTSGTESMPKGVPLTHANILSNLRAALHSIKLFSSDRVLSMLPPFHSFGFAVTGLMPLLAGLRVYYSPSPLDAPRLAHSLRYWKISLLCSAPSFLKNILRRGVGDEPFTSLRIVVSGAERAPEELYSLVNQSTAHASLVEGYGITECSPVLTINTKGKAHGVGAPLSNVRLKIVDPENYGVERSQVRESGMILASGPNIFSGYLQPELPQPFYVEGPTKWYITGDMGMIDEKGSLHITGRLKRFVKMGGEMISLGAIEDTLEGAFSVFIPRWKEEMQEKMMKGGSLEAKRSQGLEVGGFAVIPLGEEEGRPKLILFTPYPVTVQEVNMALRKKGFSNLVKIDSIQIVPELPIMGTGKIAYRTLQAMLEPARV